MATYTKLEDKVNNRKIQVESAVRDGAGKNIENNYAKQDGYYQGLGAGISDATKSIISDRAIDDAAIACPPIIFGVTGDEAEIETGVSKFESLSGKTIKWNQGFNNGSKCITPWVGDMSVIYENKGTSQNPQYRYKLSQNSWGYCLWYGTNPGNKKGYAGHKYFCSFKATNTYDANVSIPFVIFNEPNSFTALPGINNVRVIITANTTNETSYFTNRIPIVSGDPAYDMIYEDINVIDLTEIYGAGNEPTTVAEFKKDFPEDYYPYNAGSLVSSKSTSLISIGKNQFSGLNEFIRVLPNTEYELSGITAGGYIEEYDATKTLIQTSSEITSITNITLTANTCYVKIQATTYSNIMLYITFGSDYNEPYEQYKKQTIELPNIELRGIGDIQDIAYANGGGLRKIGYNTLANIPQFNQIVPITDDDTTTSGIRVIRNSADNTITVDGESTSTSASANVSLLSLSDSVIASHKYLIRLSVISGSFTGTPYLAFPGLLDWSSGGGLSFAVGSYYKFVTASATTANMLIRMYVRMGSINNTYTNLKFRLELLDLTEIYGAGNEPTTSSDFNILFKDYCQYKAATENLDGAVKYNYLTADYTNYAYTLTTPIEIPLSENPGWDTDIFVDNFGTLQFTSTQLPQIEQPYFIKYTISLTEFLDGTYVRAGGSAENLVNKEDLKDTVEKVEDGTIVSGLSENFNTKLSIDDNSAYLFRTSGGALEITNNDRLKSVIGGTIVMNQMLPISSVASTTKTGVTFTNNNDGSWTIDTGSGSATDNAYLLIHTNLTYKGGHVYLLKGNMGNGSSTTFYLSDNYSGAYAHQDYGYGCIFIASSANISNVNIALRVLNGTTVSNVKIIPQLIDLTQMFGSTIANYINTLETNNAGAGVAFIKQFLPNDYYAYNTGSFVNVKTTGKKVVGFNAYNNDNGTAKLLGSNQYQITGTYTSLSYTNILGKSETITPNGNGKFTPTYNGTLTVEGGSTDTCVHLVWDGERDGEFEEYKETTYPIEDIELKGFIKLDSNNNLYNDGDEYKSDGTVVRNFGVATPANIPQFNQFYLSDVEHNSIADNGITCVIDSDGTVTISGTATANAQIYFWSYAMANVYHRAQINFISGHKYYIYFSASSTTGITYGIYRAGNSYLDAISNRTIWDCPKDSNNNLLVWVKVANGTAISGSKVIKPQFIDLTQLFGAGNEPSTVTEFINLFPGSYSPKDASANTDGSIICDYLTADYNNYLYKSLSDSVVETANPFTENQIVDNWGTEEFIDTRDIKVLVGNKTEYLPDLKAKLEVAPDSPENDGLYVMKRENGTNSYSPLNIVQTSGQSITDIMSQKAVTDIINEHSEYKFIETITIDNATTNAIERSQTPNGDNYNFKSILLLISNSAATASTDNVRFVVNGLDIYALDFDFDIGNTSRADYQSAAITLDGDITWLTRSAASTRQGRASLGTNRQRTPNNMGTAITQFKLYNNNASIYIPQGITINIYGK